MTFLLETTHGDSRHTRVWSYSRTSVRRLARSCRDVIPSPLNWPRSTSIRSPRSSRSIN